MRAIKKQWYGGLTEETTGECTYCKSVKAK